MPTAETENPSSVPPSFYDELPSRPSGFPASHTVETVKATPPAVCPKCHTPLLFGDPYCLPCNREARVDALRPEPKVKRYVGGFAFNHTLMEVALIEKTKPAWQAGRLNGVGGKIEPGETPLQAMVREFREETTVDTEFFRWRHYAQLTIRADVKVGQVEPASVDFFCAVLPRELGWNVQTNTEERVIWTPLEQVTHHSARLLPNLCWLIPMALRHLQGETVRFAHIIEN